MNHYPTTIIDNFLKKPDKFRKFALNQSYYTVKDFSNFKGNSTFPGWRSKDLREINVDIFNQIFSKVVSIFHPGDYDQVNWEIESYFQSVPSKFQEGVIHHDHNTLLAGILYLNPKPKVNSGTCLFKKNDLFNENDFVSGTLQNDYRKGVTTPDIRHHEMFTETMNVENIYNRIILYEGHEFHKANNFFGTSIEDSRLTLVFFVKNINANKAFSVPKNRINSFQI
jgi:hypothetical protein